MTTTTGRKLDRSEREALLQRFPPRYPDPDADHVTLACRAVQSNDVLRERGWRPFAAPVPITLSAARLR